VVTHHLQVERRTGKVRRPTFYHCATPPTNMTHQGAARDAASVGYIFVGVGYYEDGHTY